MRLLTKICLSAWLFAHSHAICALTSERILGVEITTFGVTYQVKSNGCTTKDNFRIRALNSSPLQIELLRNKTDNCKITLALGTKISYTYAELGLKAGQKFRLTNFLAQNSQVPTSVAKNTAER